MKLNDSQVALVQRILSSPEELEAVRQVLEDQFDLNKAVDAETPNVLLGELTRARLTGRDLLREGFKELQKYKKVEQTKKSNVNNAV